MQPGRISCKNESGEASLALSSFAMQAAAGEQFQRRPVLKTSSEVLINMAQKNANAARLTGSLLWEVRSGNNAPQLVGGRYALTPSPDIALHECNQSSRTDRQTDRQSSQSVTQ